MSAADTPPRVKRPYKRSRLLIIIGTVVVVLLAIIAVAVSSQAIRASDQAAAKEKAIAQQSAIAKIADDAQRELDALKVKNAEEANTVCERQVLKRYPTATIQTGKTKSTSKASDGSYDTVGAYTDKPAGNPIPVQFVCSSIKGSGTSWTVFLKPKQ